MSNPWDALADSIIGTVRESTSDFLEDNVAAKEFLEERAKALAKAIYEYKMAPSEGKAAAQHEMNIIRQTIENKLAAIALHGLEESKSVFKKILNAVFSAFVKAAPVLLAMI